MKTKLNAESFSMHKRNYHKHNNKISSVISIPKVRAGKGSVYADLTPTLGGREVVSHRPSAQENTLSYTHLP